MTRTCLTCRRSALPNLTLCAGCCDRLLAQAFGTPEKEYRVERLSAAMPELQIAGRRS